MTKRTAYEDMVTALEFYLLPDGHFLDCGALEAGEFDDCEEHCRFARAALTKAKKVPVEVGMFGTGAPEDVVYQRIFSGCPTPPRAGDVAEVKRASKGHPPGCVCWACACLRKLKGRGTL